ncbi:hypothetical protein P879_03342 [Paragonimus westermani]|uniref:Uncharacterized protein n=1 Tax=Paragonimus westermani TaxID=34504 RepID=A0A8T0DA14_9TREM|nr:hypothetical protein P879_03342 [Paragonimus westermani]
MQADRQPEEMPHEQILQDSSLNQLSGTGYMDYIPSECLGVWEYYPTPSISGSPAVTHNTLEATAAQFGDRCYILYKLMGTALHIPGLVNRQRVQWKQASGNYGTTAEPNSSLTVKAIRKCYP